MLSGKRFAVAEETTPHVRRKEDVRGEWVDTLLFKAIEPFMSVRLQRERFVNWRHRELPAGCIQQLICQVEKARFDTGRI